MRYTTGMNTRTLLIVARFFFSLLAFTAITVQLVVHIQNGYSVVNFFGYFTNLSNIFAASVLLMSALSSITRRIPTATNDIVRGSSVVCMAVVGIVFSVLLRDEDVGTLLPWVNAVAHYVMPVVVVLDWCVQQPKTLLVLRQTVYWLIAPSVYVGYSIIRGAIVGWYPYPFFDPAKSGGYGGVAVYCLAILVLFLVLCWLVMTAGNTLGRARSPAHPARR